MDERILEQLYQPFELRERKGVGNKVFKYVTSEDIVDRMNKAFKGNWSTEVKKAEVIEDQVLMCVRVSAQDPTDADARLQWHDGYASHPIARYTSGPNNGKMIDIGNTYKSAMSKAIKTAVAKWGVALYLDQESNSDAPTPDVPVVTPTAPAPTTPAKPKIEPPVVAGPPVGGPPIMKGPPIDTPSVSKSTMDGSPSRFQPPVFTVDNTDPSLKDGGLDIPSGLDGGGGEKLTPVQRVAVETIMSVNNMTFHDLLVKSLLREDNLPQSLDDISYLDAVTIIQYGNNLRQI